MTYIASNGARFNVSDHSIQVGPVDINLAAMFMHDSADIADTGFKNAVRGRIGDHYRCQVVAVRLGLDPKIIDINVTLVITVNNNHFHAAHLC